MTIICIEPENSMAKPATQPDWPQRPDLEEPGTSM
jgi:hypothetical protein